jgi:hypothetical protein
MRLIAALGMLSACSLGVRGPQGGAVKTGERVAVVDDVRVWTTQYQEHTGTTEHRDGDGNVVGTSDTYRDRTAVHRKKIWYPVQGKEQLRDEDFFKITGDEISMKKAQEHRESGRLYSGLGMAGMLVGIAGMIAGRVAMADNQSLGIGLYCGGGIVGLAGAYSFYVGREMQSPESHAVDRSVADTAARDYNRQLGASVGIGRKF